MGTNINSAAFADDLVFFAGTPAGLQHLLDFSVDFLGKCGLSTNIDKSHTLAIVADKKLKKTVVDEKRVFNCRGRPIKALTRTSEWTYLGIRFTGEGRKRVTINNTSSFR